MRLYELTEEALSLMAALEDAEGITDETKAKAIQDYFDGATAEKLEGYCKMIRSLSAEAKAYKDEKMELAKRQSALENQVERLQGGLLNHLTATGRTEANAGLFTVKLQTNPPSVLVEDESLIDKAWFKYTPTLMRAEILEALKSGCPVPGCSIGHGTKVVIK
jgi:hypothetical protein